MSALPTVVAGVITEGPTEPGPVSSMLYGASVNMDGTLYESVPVRRPVIHQWNTIVRPIPIGTGIIGVLLNGKVQWHFRELPDLGPCNGGGGTPEIPAGDGEPGGVGRPIGPVQGGVSPVTRFLLSATVAELQALKRALEAV